MSRWSIRLADLTATIVRTLSALGRNELTTIVSLLILCGCLWIFVEIADEVLEGETHQFDRSILLALRNSDDPSDPWGPAWVEELFRDLTALGGVGVLGFVTLAAVGFLLIERKAGAAGLLLAAVVGGWLVSTLLKWGFDRPRPDLVPHGSHIYTASFPSGHAMMSAVTYLTIGALLARVHSALLTKAYFLILGAMLTLAVGVSRVYLGVHWPTDVLAGWTLGGGWALLCWTAARFFQRRGDVEDANSVKL